MTTWRRVRHAAIVGAVCALVYFVLTGLFVAYAQWRGWR